MLVFGAVQFKASNDGGIEIIQNDLHQYLTSDEVHELVGWINCRPIKRANRYEGLAGGQVAPDYLAEAQQVNAPQAIPY